MATKMATVVWCSFIALATLVIQGACLECYECLDVRMTSTNGLVGAILAHAQTHDPSCRLSGDQFNARPSDSTTCGVEEWGRRKRSVNQALAHLQKAKERPSQIKERRVKRDDHSKSEEDYSKEHHDDSKDYNYDSREDPDGSEEHHDGSEEDHNDDFGSEGDYRDQHYDDYYDSQHHTEFGCQKAHMYSEIQMFGATVEVEIHLRGCMPREDIPLACAHDPKALHLTELRHIGLGLDDDHTQGSLCLCDTNLCNAGSHVTGCHVTASLALAVLLLLRKLWLE